MKLINTLNSHADLVKSQLESTDAILVEVYSGNSDVVFTGSSSLWNFDFHAVLVREREIQWKVKFSWREKLVQALIDKAAIHTIYANLIEISIPVKQ